MTATWKCQKKVLQSFPCSLQTQRFCQREHDGQLKRHLGYNHAQATNTINPCRAPRTARKQRKLIKRSKDVTQTQQQRPESTTAILTWYASKYKVHNLHQRYILKKRGASTTEPKVWVSASSHNTTCTVRQGASTDRETRRETEGVQVCNALRRINRQGG